jgi:hypothetical protein
MAFGEGFAGGNFIYRSAVMMTVLDAKEVANAILAAISVHEAAVKEPPHG